MGPVPSLLPGPGKQVFPGRLPLSQLRADPVLLLREAVQCDSADVRPAVRHVHVPDLVLRAVPRHPLPVHLGGGVLWRNRRGHRARVHKAQGDHQAIQSRTQGRRQCDLQFDLHVRLHFAGRYRLVRRRAGWPPSCGARTPLPRRQPEPRGGDCAAEDARHIPGSGADRRGHLRLRGPERPVSHEALRGRHVERQGEGLHQLPSLQGLRHPRPDGWAPEGRRQAPHGARPRAAAVLEDDEQTAGRRVRERLRRRPNRRQETAPCRRACRRRPRRPRRQQRPRRQATLVFAAPRDARGSAGKAGRGGGRARAPAQGRPLARPRRWCPCPASALSEWCPRPGEAPGRGGLLEPPPAPFGG
mmetsp:Transcript_18228/g.48870  ORF Transcript_18228/g.48870 Transcript_18228/m.48870 type:complete len:358 (-) Transcript_18228:107-1180(-)